MGRIPGSDGAQMMALGLAMRDSRTHNTVAKQWGEKEEAGDWRFLLTVNVCGQMICHGGRLRKRKRNA